MGIRIFGFTEMFFFFLGGNVENKKDYFILSYNSSACSGQMYNIVF